MEYRDCCRILGINEQATRQEIKAAFRRLARQYHPDLNPGNRQAETRFKEINAAYQALNNSTPAPPAQQARSSAGSDGFNWMHWAGGTTRYR